METLVLLGIVAVVVFAACVYFVWRYNSQATTLAGTLVTDEKKLANTVSSVVNSVSTDISKLKSTTVTPVVTTPVANVVPVVVAPVIVVSANTVSK